MGERSRTQAERSASTRARFLAAARRGFSERGFDGVPLDWLLQETGLSKGAFYHHFRDKRELLAQLYEEMEQEVTGRLRLVGRDLPDPLARIDAGCQAFLDECLDPEFRRIALVEAPAVLGWAAWREIDARYGFGLLMSGLRAAAREGRILDDELLLRGHLLLAALMEAALVLGASGDPARVRPEVGRLISQQVRALAIT